VKHCFKDSPWRTAAARSLRVPEQLQIVELIKTAFAEIDRLAGEAAAARRLLGRLDQAIPGQIGAQCPADEPATVLLDRIRAERTEAPACAPTRPESQGRLSVAGEANFCSTIYGLRETIT